MVSTPFRAICLSVNSSWTIAELAEAIGKAMHIPFPGTLEFDGRVLYKEGVPGDYSTPIFLCGITPDCTLDYKMTLRKTV